MVARWNCDRRTAGRRDDEHGIRLAGEARGRHSAGNRRDLAMRRTSVPAHGARGRWSFSEADVWRAVESSLFRALLLDVSHGGVRARARTMGGSGSQPHGSYARHPAPGVRQRAHVFDAAFCRTVGA